MTSKKPATSPEFTAQLRDYVTRRQLSDRRAALALGVPLGTYRKWAAGTRAPSAAAARLLDILCTLDALAPNLLDMMEPAEPPKAKRGRKTPHKPESVLPSDPS